MVTKELDTASNSVNRATNPKKMYLNFISQAKQLSELANCLGQRKKDPYVKYFGLAIDHAIVGSETGSFDFPYFKEKKEKMVKNMIDDYAERKKLFLTTVEMCEKFSELIIAGGVAGKLSKREVEAWRLIYMLSSMFHNEKVTNVKDYFELAQYSVDAPQKKEVGVPGPAAQKQN